MRRLAFSLTALALLTALMLAGCGGGNESRSTDTTAASAQKQSTTTEGEAAKKEKSAEEKQAKKSGEGAKREQGGAREQSARAKARDIPVGEPVPGSKAVAPGVPTVKGGDNSIQSFGTEGEEDQRDRALANLIAYTSARLAGEWARACALASQGFRRGLAQLIANAKAKGDAEKPKGCAETLKLFTPEKAKTVIGEKSRVSEVLSFRIEEPYAYLIFKGAKGKVRFIAMEGDEGQWRVNVLEPEAFQAPAQG